MIYHLKLGKSVSFQILLVGFSQICLVTAHYLTRILCIGIFYLYFKTSHLQKKKQKLLLFVLFSVCKFLHFFLVLLETDVRFKLCELFYLVFFISVVVFSFSAQY